MSVEGLNALLVSPADLAERVDGCSKTRGMIFGKAPPFDAILVLIGALEGQLNRA